MRGRSRRMTVGLTVLLVLAVALVACSDEGGGDPAPATTQAAETSDTEAAGTDDTEAPASEEPPETEAPTTTAAAEEPPTEETATGGEAAEAEPDLEPADVPVWVWILAGLVLLVAVIWMVTRSGSTEVNEETTQPEPPADS